MAIIGFGGRTGTMFSFELKDSAQILGVAKKKEIQLAREKKIYVKRKGRGVQPFEGKVIEDIDYGKEFTADIIFLTTKNPILEPIKYYFRSWKKNRVPGEDFDSKGKIKIPALLISQNGIAAISEAKKALFEVLGKDAEKVRLVRVILFNPIGKESRDGKSYIKYSLPIRIALSKVSGSQGIDDILNIFEKANFKIKEFPSKDAKNIEFSKLFLNLIGMAAASRGVSIKDGFKNKEIFREEVKALKEYIKAVKFSGGKFLNLPRYPVKIFIDTLSFFPTQVLLSFRNIISKIVSKGRNGKPKDLDEIDYYNGAVVSLGKKIGVKTPINEIIYKRVKREFF